MPAAIYGGADVAAADAKGDSGFLPVSCNVQEEATALLLHQGAPIDQADEARGNNAFMGVAFKGYSVIAKLFLDAGANPHAVNRSGQTALMLASLSGHYPIVDMLLALGADPFAMDLAGNSAISVAADHGNEMMANHLQTMPPLNSEIQTGKRPKWTDSLGIEGNFVRAVCLLKGLGHIT